jgi:DNA-binding NtrC family response regulator
MFLIHSNILSITTLLVGVHAFIPLMHIYLCRLSRILLVEDEMDLMQLYRDILCGVGHDVDGFTDPLEAYAHFQEKSSQYDAVISDINMSGMSGIELAKKLKEIRNDVQVFLMSAFEIAEDHNSDLREIGLEEFLQKPFHMQQLISMVEKRIGHKEITNSMLKQ